MIIDKQPLPDDPTPSDAPPSYDTLNQGSTSTKSSVSDQKLPPGQENVGQPRRPAAIPISPSASSSTSIPSPYSPAQQRKGKGKESTWFKFTKSPEDRRMEQVENTVLGLIWSLIEEHNGTSSLAAPDILSSCAQALRGSSLSLSQLLQRKSMEGHTPFYWTVVKRLPDQHQNVDEHQGADLLSILISFASPLTKDTITDLRLACLATSDQALFQRLRMSPEFAPISASDRLLLGMTIPPDEIEVHNLPGDTGAFIVDIVIPHFHKRMAVTKKITIEFIARSRLWSLMFYIVTEQDNSTMPQVGSWCICLSLQETSPPTHITSQLVIEPVNLAPSPPTSPKPHLTIGAFLSSKGPRQLSIPIASNRGELQPGFRSIYVPLGDKGTGAGLQYGNDTYIAADEKLRARFEAKLEKGPDDCIIC